MESNFCWERVENCAEKNVSSMSGCLGSSCLLGFESLELIVQLVVLAL